MPQTFIFRERSGRQLEKQLESGYRQLTRGIRQLSRKTKSYAMSRAHERRADRFALELTRNPAAFISAMRRLAAQNLAEERPSRVVQWLFYSHPPIRERIAAAQAFRPPVS